MLLVSLVNYRPSESPVAQMSVVAGLVASTAQALSLSFQEKSVLLRICQSFGSSVTYDVYRSVDGVVDSEPMVSGVSDAFYLSVVLGQENSILVLSLRAAGYYPILLTVSYLYQKDLLFISQVGATGEMKYKMFNSSELSQNLDYTIDSFTAVPDLSIDTLPKVIDFLSGFVTTDNLKQYIADQVDVFEIVQGPGSSTTAVMSQNAVTEELLQKVGVDAVVGTTGNSSNLVMSQAAVTEALGSKASSADVTAAVSNHNMSSTAHIDIRELLNTCVGSPVYDESTYKITFTTLDGVVTTIDLPIEQMALRYNAATESIEFDNADGTTTSIPVSAFVKEYVGSIGDQIQVSIDTNNIIHATVLKNSIDWDSLSLALQERINSHVSSEEFATQAIRTDIEQTLSIEAQNQALENIGADLMIIDLVNGQAVLTEEQEARLLSCKGVILRGATNSPEVLSYIFHMDNSSGNIVAFYSFKNGSFYLTCQYTKSTRTFRVVGTSAIRDNSAVIFNRKQSLTTSQQAQAFANLGMKVYVTDSSFLGSTLSAEEIEEVIVSKAILFTDTGDLFLFGSQDPNRISFYRFTNNYYIHTITVAKSTGFVSGIGSLAYVDKDALHFTVKSPALTSAQQSQAFENLGWKVHVISESAIGSSDAVSDDEKAARLSATALLVQETGLLYNFSISSGGSRRFYGQFSNSFCTALNVNEATGVITSSFAYLYDPSAVSFDRDQSSVSDDNKNKALGNIGIDFVRIPYSLLNTTLSDEMMEVVDNARGIILVNVPENFNRPTVYTKGFNTPSMCRFFALENTTVMVCIDYNKSNKKLYSVLQVDLHFDSVRYSVSQNLTDVQKQQARTNIGVQSADELLADDDFIAQLKTKLGIA